MRFSANFTDYLGSVATEAHCFYWLLIVYGLKSKRSVWHSGRERPNFSGKSPHLCSYPLADNDNQIRQSNSFGKKMFNGRTCFRVSRSRAISVSKFPGSITYANMIWHDATKFWSWPFRQGFVTYYRVHHVPTLRRGSQPKICYHLYVCCHQAV